MKYALKKIVTIASTLLVISLLTFGVFQILPGNPVDIILGVDADPLQVKALTQQLGLDLPLGQRYISWITGILKGDMGNSIRYQVPVEQLLKQSLPVTISLTLMSMLITLIVVVPVSIFLAKHNNKKVGVLISFIMQIGIAIPSFWVGILLVMFFSVTLHWLPSGDYSPLSQGFLNYIRSLLLPSLSIAIGSSAVVIRYLKTTILDNMNMDYVRTARSKGVARNKVLYKHVLRNALLPTITILGMLIVNALGGSIIVENVFNLPGTGHLVITGVANRDFPLVQSVVFYLAATVVFINLITDLLYAIIDPRIRLT
ncbi:MAG: ABC transporter permease [Spirochaetales bacterium]|nr:ABC transporter permease [Spirochaetales bacterium]